LGGVDSDATNVPSSAPKTTSTLPGSTSSAIPAPTPTITTNITPTPNTASTPTSTIDPNFIVYLERYCGQYILDNFDPSKPYYLDEINNCPKGAAQATWAYMRANP
jgi:hypothetical protein